MIHITEEMKVHEEWYVQAHDITLDDLPKFIEHLMNDYDHDYGTICHALTAGSIATMYAMNKHEQGGITGFQAGCIMWMFIRKWLYSENKTGLRMLNYDDILYPQYKHKFDKTISPDIWNSIQKEAAAKIQESIDADNKYTEELKLYNEAFSEYVEKHPDYHARPEFYERLMNGTVDEWEAEHEKEKSGFEFAPRKPYNSKAADSVIRHWESIVDGSVPFDYVIRED